MMSIFLLFLFSLQKNNFFIVFKRRSFPFCFQKEHFLFLWFLFLFCLQEEFVFFLLDFVIWFLLLLTLYFVTAFICFSFGYVYFTNKKVWCPFRKMGKLPFGEKRREAFFSVFNKISWRRQAFPSNEVFFQVERPSFSLEKEKKEKLSFFPKEECFFFSSQEARLKGKKAFAFSPKEWSFLFLFASRQAFFSWL